MARPPLKFMAHKFKARTSRIPLISAPARANRQERELRKYAALITTQEQLDSLIFQMKPEVREAARRRIADYLKFRPAKSPTLVPTCSESASDL